MAKPIITNNFGKLTGWNSITVNIMGRDVVGISEINYSDSTKKENVYGAGGNPIGRSEGNYEAKASISLLKEEVDAIQQKLPKGMRVQDIPAFDVIVLYDRKGKIQKDIINYVEFTGRAVDVKQNDGTIVEKHELIVSTIDWNV